MIDYDAGTRRACAECTGAEFDALLMAPGNRILPHSRMASALKQVLVEGADVADAARLAGLSTAGKDRGPRTATHGRRGLQRALKEWRERLAALRGGDDLDAAGAPD